jgi:hypothetical protein
MAKPSGTTGPSPPLSLIMRALRQVREKGCELLGELLSLLIYIVLTTQ